ncbi:MAG: formate dehydrogenase subunit gamma [Halofilum sp. (in: g-proteobacteria)]
MSTVTVSNESRARRAHKRALGWSLVAILVGAVVAPLGGYVYVAQAQDEAAWEQNPRSETWRDAREGEGGYTSASGPFTTNTLIDGSGENWRQARNGPVAGLTPWLMAIALLAIGLFHIFFGRNRLEETPSGNRVKRWAGWERTLHWFTASTFIVLAITGLSLLFGRAVLIPLMGPEGFAAWAGVAKSTHNLIGPAFTVGVLLILVSWMRYNIPNRTDVEWFKKGGGLIGKGHASAGRMNGGEKAWFWFIATAGVVVCATGLILDFPNFQQSRGVMQLSSLIHAVVSIGWIALALGHVYIGTLGTEGALEGMTTGYVSEEWARQHHDQWLDEVKGQAGATEEEPVPGGGPAHGPAQRQPD